MADAEAVTAKNEELHVVFAFNYGGRADIARAARRAAALVADGQLRPDQIDEALVGSLMGIPGMPDADLIVRSSGEHRISNFLLWQAAYAELVFPNILWPDYGAQELVDSVVEYQSRVRRFGTA
jgi:undecaprenyl diphosphate synthase